MLYLELLCTILHAYLSREGPLRRTCAVFEVGNSAFYCMTYLFGYLPSTLREVSHCYKIPQLHSGDVKRDFVVVKWTPDQTGMIHME